MLVVKDDSEKAHQYAIMRRRATALLAVFALVFVATAIVAHLRPALSPFWIGLLRATAEAAMVGGIADWFAVTALFRHPLGLPIPHTAIIPEKKDQIGEGLAGFVHQVGDQPHVVRFLGRPARDLVDIDAYRRIWLAHHGEFSLNMMSTQGR